MVMGLTDPIVVASLPFQPYQYRQNFVCGFRMFIIFVSLLNVYKEWDASKVNSQRKTTAVG